MTPDQHLRKLLTDWARILERDGCPRDVTEAAANELWQALRGHGARVTWPPDDPAPHRATQTAPGAHSAAAAAVRAELRHAPPPAAPPERELVLGIPPWKAEPDADQA